MSVAEKLSTNALREVLRLLVRSSELVSQPEHWTQGAWARDRKGKPVGPATKRAFAWCLAGAVLRAEAELFGTKLQRGPATAGDWGLPSPIRGPKRLEGALSLLAFPMAVICLRMHEKELNAADETAKKAKDAKPDTPEAVIEDSQVAAMVNDFPNVRHEHVLLALRWATTQVRDELRERRSASARSPKRKRGGH